MNNRQSDTAPPVSAGSSDVFVLPEWVDEALFADFCAGAAVFLEDFDANVEALAAGDAHAMAELRRRIHTLKGEAGVLGLERLERGCHDFEDRLMQPDIPPLVELEVIRDWLDTTVQTYSQRRQPQVDLVEVLVALSKAASTPPKCVAAAAVAKINDLQEGDTRRFDEDSLEVISEFLQEADDELSQVDEILLGAQQDALTKEQIDAIFRIFHTIKGVAGFLELEDVCVLAHATEHLLDGARVGRLRIEGDNLDLVFRATEDMRARLDRLKATAPSGYSFATLGALRALLHQISDVADPSHEEQSDALTALRTSSAVGGRSEQAAPVRATANPGGGTQARIKEFVKVDLERVDNFVTLVGELVIVESMIANAPELRHNLSPWLRAQLTQMSKITRDLQDIGTRMRMVPIRSVFQKMARMVRNLCQRSDKEVAVHITGEGTEIDRSMVEQVSSPLVHMIRNAVDHGIETPNERRACGKDPCGTIRLRASHQGGSVVIEVSDDGRGLNTAAILARARDRGLVNRNVELSTAQIHDLIFAPGFSTAAVVTEISGRGVGMDVVRRNIEALRGNIRITSTPGQGSCFTVELPLTLGIINGMLVTCGTQRYIIPTLSVVESVKPEASMLVTIAERGELVQLRNETFPLLRLDRLFAINGAKQDPKEGLIVVVESRNHKVGLLVDDILNQQQVVIKSMGAALPNMPHLAGAAIMPDGLVGLILNPDAMVERDIKTVGLRVNGMQHAC